MVSTRPSGRREAGSPRAGRVAGGRSRRRPFVTPGRHPGNRIVASEGRITRMRRRRPSHVSVDARTESVGLSDGGTVRGRGGGDRTNKGGCYRGRFGSGAATVPFRSSRLFGDPQLPGSGGGGRAESIDRCAAAPQPS